MPLCGILSREVKISGLQSLPWHRLCGGERGQETIWRRGYRLDAKAEMERKEEKTQEVDWPNRGTGSW